MSHARLLISFILFLDVGAVATAQRIWTVDMLQRPGTDFVDLPSAVAAASSGDIVRVRGTTTTPPCGPFGLSYWCGPSPDSYVAPTIQGKALTIVGDRQLPRPRVSGAWDIHSLVAGQVVALEYLDLRGRAVYINGQWQSFSILAASNAGAIVLDDVVAWPFDQDAASDSGLWGTRFIDCGLVVIRNSRINTDGGPWIVLRSTMMVSGSVVENTPCCSVSGPGALFLHNSRLHIHDSRIVGAYAIPQTNPPFPSPQPAGTPAITTNGSEIVVSGNSVLEGGVDLVSRLEPIVATNHANPVFTTVTPSHCHIDPSTTTIGPMVVRTLLQIDHNPQTGLSCMLSPTTLTVTHYTQPRSLSVLAIGDLQTTPWTNVVGPVFVDPTTAIDFFDAVHLSVPFQRTFAVPPGLPPGLQLCLQAFELQATGVVSTSNATVLGIW